MATTEIIRFLPPANEVWGKVIFSEACVKNSVHRGVVSQHALQVVSQHALQVSGGVVSQHALQVSRPTPKGEVEGSGMGRRVSRPTPMGEVEGSGLWGVSTPTPRGGLQAHTQGGLKAHTQGVSRLTPGGVSRPTPGRGLQGGISRPTPGGWGYPSMH